MTTENKKKLHKSILAPWKLTNQMERREVKYLLKAIFFMILKPDSSAEVQGSVVDEVQGVLGVVQHQIVEIQANHTTIFNFPN